MEPTAEKVRAITDAPQPKTASELCSFLGTVGFNSRFIPDLSTTAAITQKGAEFRWGKQQEAAFKKLKQQLAAASSLAYFDTEAPTEVIADASPVGIGAILIQEQQGVRRAVCYASRTLTDVERRYSQTEKEALALVWSCERFHQYLLGRKFTLTSTQRSLSLPQELRDEMMGSATPSLQLSCPVCTGM